MPLYIPRDRQSLFRQFLAGMYDAVIITDPMGHLLEVNQRAEEFFQIVNEEVIDRHISNYITGLSSELVQRIRRGLDEDRHMMIDGSGLRTDGTKFPCEIAVSSIDLNEKDDLIFTIRNVERRKAMFKSFKAKANAFEAAHAALFATDKAGKFVEVNKAFLDMFGLEGEDKAKELSFSDIFTDKPLPENFLKALEGEESCVGIVAEGEAEDEEEVEVILAPNREGRKITGVVGSVIKA